MLEIYIGDAFDPQRVIVRPTATVRQVYEENHKTIGRDAVVTHKNARLGDNELDKTLADLGIEDGDLITVTQKLNGAR